MTLRSIRSLDYSVLLCRDVQKTKAFYRDVMRFPMEHDSPGWVDFRVGSSTLALRPRDAEGPMPPVASVQLAFRVAPSDLEGCHADLLAHGIVIERGPLDVPGWRHRAIFFRDPERNIIEIYAEQ